MRVFAWVAYGDVEVHKAATEEDLAVLQKLILDSIEYLGAEEDEIKEIVESKIPSIRKINNLIELIGIGTHETFEYGTGFTTLK